MVETGDGMVSGRETADGMADNAVVPLQQLLCDG